MSKSRKTIYVYGKQPVSEAIESNWPVFDILVRGRGNDRHKDPVLVEARNRGIKVSVMEPRDFDSRFPKASQGIAAKVGDVVFRELEQLLAAVPRGQAPLFVALDGIQDPQNLGSICRVSHAMGVHGLVVPRRRTAPFGEGAFKASAGALFYLPVSEVPNIHWFVQWCKKHGIWVCGLEGTAETSVWETDLTVPIALIVGSEGRGLSRLVRERCDYLARIPMLGKIDSLNAAVACGMALYEVQRQMNSPRD
jgi:23S rRNA (guanosine2251-2'-O)-methyltransferase